MIYTTNEDDVSTLMRDN